MDHTGSGTPRMVPVRHGPGDPAGVAFRLGEAESDLTGSLSCSDSITANDAAFSPGRSLRTSSCTRSDSESAA